MKLLRLSLLVLFSVTPGLLVFLMLTQRLPTLRLEWPNAAYTVELMSDEPDLAPRFLVANDPEPARTDVEIAAEPKQREGEASAEPQRRDSFTAADPTDAAQETPKSDSTITATADGSRVHLQMEDGFSVEANQIVLEQSDAHVIGQGELVTEAPQPAPKPTAAANAAANPIPEFLRQLFQSRELPPIELGEKVVTIHVSVDNWLDLTWGDIVSVQSEAQGVGWSNTGVAGTVRLDVVDRVEIYALPTIAPETGDSVPVCLKVNSEQARKLLKFRGSGWSFKLTGSQKPAVSSSTKVSAESGDLRNVTVVDNPPSPAALHELHDLTIEGSFPDSVEQPAAIAEPVPVPAAPLVHPQPLDASNAIEPFEQPQPVEPVPTVRAPLDQPLPAEAFESPAPAEGPLPVDAVEVPVPVAGNSDPTDAPLLAEQPSVTPGEPVASQPTVEDVRLVEVREPAVPRADSRAEQLPEIEPSEAGTVTAISMGSGLSLAAGASLIVEEENGGRFARVSGFDPKIIRVTPRSPHRLLIEGLAAGDTVLTIIVPGIYKEPLRVSVTVEASEKQLQAEQVLRDLEVPASSWRALGITAPQVKPGTNGIVHQVHGDSSYAVAQGKAVRFEFSEPIVTVDDFDPQVIQVIAENSQRLKVTGNVAGITSIRIRCKSDQAEATYVLGMRVDAWESSHEELAGILRDLYPDADIKLVAIRDSVLLRGTAASNDERNEINEIAQQYAPRVLNQLRISADARTSDASSKQRLVMLVFADVEKLKPLSQGDRVNLIRGREVRNHDKVEFEEAIVAEDAEIVRVHISGDQGLLGVRVSPLEAHVLSETDTAQLQVVVTHKHESSEGSSKKPGPSGTVPEGKRRALLKDLPPSVVRSFKPGDHVDVIRAFVVKRVVTEQRDGRVVTREVNETAQQQLAKDVEVGAVLPEKNSVGLFVTPEVAGILLKIPSSELNLQPSSQKRYFSTEYLHDQKPSDPLTAEAAAAPTFSPDGPTTYTPDGSPTYKPGESPTYTPGNPPTYQPDVPVSDSNKRQSKTVTLSRECIVAVNPDGKLDLNSCSKCHADSAQLNQASYPSPDPLRDDIHALHDDVRKLITLLEQRLSQHNPGDYSESHPPAKTYSPEADAYQSKPQPSDEFKNPKQSSEERGPRSESDPNAVPSKPGSDSEAAPAADSPTDAMTKNQRKQRDFLNLWGRTMLKRDYQLASAYAEAARTADPDNPYYEQFQRSAQAARAAGASSTPLLVFARAQWCGPCRKMQPLIQDLQDHGAAIIVIDVDADSELVKQMEIQSLPTLLWMLDGKRVAEVVGFQTKDQLQKILKEMQARWPLAPPKAGETDKPAVRAFNIQGVDVGTPGGTGITMAGVASAAVEASPPNRSFNFYVGFTR